MKRVVRKTEYFLDIPAEISTTGFSPSRGLYTYIQFSDGTDLWIDCKGIEIDDLNWIAELETYRDKDRL